MDLPGVTLLPGLIDMHVHLTSDPRFGGYRGYEVTDSFWAVIGVPNAKRTLDAGFTTVRNVGAGDYADVALKQAIELGYIPGPRIVPATNLIGATGGHCDYTEFPPSIKTPTDGVANGPEAISGSGSNEPKIRRRSHQVLRHGGVMSKGDTVGGQQYDLAEMTALVNEAHMLGLRVAAHAHGTAGNQRRDPRRHRHHRTRSLADAEAFALAKSHGTYFSMDIYNDDYIVAEGEKNGLFKESLDKERAIGRLQRETFKAAFKAGVKMIYGTDAGVYPHGDNAKQFAKMVEWGMTPMQAIQSATATAAEALGRTNDVGAIAVGRYGDLVGVTGDPLQDVTRLETWHS